MGNLLSAINDDINEYEQLCRKYGEEVQTEYDVYGIRTPACYGTHASELKQRFREETASTLVETQFPVKSPEAQKNQTSDAASVETTYANIKVQLEKSVADTLNACFPDLPPMTCLLLRSCRWLSLS